MSLEKLINDRSHITKIPVSETHQIILNTLNGAIDLIPIKLLQENISQDLEVTLKERGYLASPEAQTKMIQQLRELAIRHAIHVPYWFYILTTMHCNLQCGYCYEEGIKTDSKLNMDTYQKEIEYINQIKQEWNIAQERMNIVLFGGEPLIISPENLEVILDGIKDKNRKAIIVSNGTMVEKHIQNLIRYKEQISDLRISLDGPEQLHNQRRPYKSNNGGTYQKIVENINLLLENGLTVKLQTILGKGNLNTLEDLLEDIKRQGRLEKDNFQRRIEGSHDYKNLDSNSDEISEGKMVKKIIEIYQNNADIQQKMIFESFKYLAHITDSFGRLGKRKTYRGPKYGFCEPQKGFHYVFSTDGKIYHCPRTIDEDTYRVGDIDSPIQELSKTYKDTMVRDKEICKECNVNAFCGGGCVVQKRYHPNFDCKSYANGIIQEFIALMKKEIMGKAEENKIVSINQLRHETNK